LKKTDVIIRRIVFLAATLLLAAVWILSLLPTVRSPLTFNYADKLIHFTAYAVLAFLTASSLKPERQYKFLQVFLFLFANGLLIEFIQPFTGRTFDWTDQGANALGILAGLTVKAIFEKARKKP
jgi:VanZ family protein